VRLLSLFTFAALIAAVKYAARRKAESVDYRRR